MNRAFSILVFISFCFLNSFCKKEKADSDSNADISHPKFEYYFPVQTDSLDNKYDQEGKLHPLVNDWYSSHLKSLEEPILYNKKDSSYIIRYTNLGTWDRPFCYRIQKFNSGISITHKETNGQGGYEPGKKTLDSTIFLNFEKFQKLERQINDFDFWRKPSFNERGFDGAEWILEIYKNGKYKFITRWSPRRENEAEFIDICAMIEEIYNEKSH